MDLRDRAEGGGTEIVLASDLPQEPQAEIVTGHLRPADELTPEGEFPQFGQFLEVRVNGDEESRFWECPSSLASAIVELVGDEPVKGALVKVDEAVKTTSGEWRYVVAVETAEE